MCRRGDKKGIHHSSSSQLHDSALMKLVMVSELLFTFSGLATAPDQDETQVITQPRETVFITPYSNQHTVGGALSDISALQIDTIFLESCLAVRI